MIGTSLHKLTHRLDRGEELGYVPSEWANDLKAYTEKIKVEGIEWVSVESFRVYDGWMDSTCDHTHPLNKEYDPESPCRCRGVAGTTDRIGWYKGRLRVFDIKTGSMFNKQGHAMQLAMYARSTPYHIPTDERGYDPAAVDLNIGYIIELPEGQGVCNFHPMDILKGWGSCLIAKQVWDSRKQDYSADESRTGATLADMIIRANTLEQLKMLYDNAKKAGTASRDIKKLVTQRINEIRAAS